MNIMVAELAAQELRERHARLVRQQDAGLSRAEQASRLGVTEVELVAAHCGVRATALQGPVARVLAALPAVGVLRARTGNAGCVHECQARFGRLAAGEHGDIVSGDGVELRLEPSALASCYAVSEGPELSLQFFDRAGATVHQMFMTGDSDLLAYRALVREFARGTREMPLVMPSTAAAPGPVVSDQEALRAAWTDMRSADDLAPLLRRFGISRLAALQALSPELAQEVDDCAVTHMLKVASATHLPIRCMVPGRGVTQHHAGPVARLARAGSWFKVCDPDFSLQLNTDQLSSVWVVCLPSPHCCELSLEAYGRHGELLLQCSGGEAGAAEPLAWRELMRGFCREPLHC